MLVIEPSLFCSPAAVLAARLARGKAILHVQDFEVDAAFDMRLICSPWLRRVVVSVEQWLMRRFDRVSTISGRMLQRLECKGVADDKRLFFPNWVDTELIFPMTTSGSFREELGVPKDDVVLLYSGNMGQKQGLELIIESARLLESDRHVRFVMCGQGAAYESLRWLADGLRNIQWLPLQPLEKLNELLNLADIHLLPQRANAADLVMPSKLTGMLASGRPVIATAAEGTEVWSVVEGRGINTPPGDVNAFSVAVRTLVDSVEERVRLGQNGRRYAEEYLSTDAVLERFEKELLLLTGKA
jgi:colanic acid biosynthesis glycosyl transferase WcaI